MKNAPFYKQLLELAKQQPHLKRLWIFGSRVRGDASLLSDYDLAFDWDPEHRSEWIRFKLYLEDALKTLHSIDFVYMPEASESLKKEIHENGKLIYEKK